jgi:hypothetical protein
MAAHRGDRRMMAMGSAPPRLRTTLAVALLLALGFGGGWTWLQLANAGRVDAPATPPGREAVDLKQAQTLAGSAGNPGTGATRAQPTQQGNAVAMADDPAARSAAIRALGMASAADAVPVLRQLMDSGEPQERSLAVAALRELALREGDADGSIRQLLRIQFHDGGDESTAHDAREALAELEDRLPAS